MAHACTQECQPKQTCGKEKHRKGDRNRERWKEKEGRAIKTVARQTNKEK